MSSENTGATRDTAAPAGSEQERMASLENQIKELRDRLASLADRRETPPFSDPPIGTVVAYAGEVDANFEELQGWLLCDGRPLSASGTYEYLSRTLGTTYGDGRDASGNQVGDFNLPDYRGYFLRGVDAGSGVDKGLAERRSPRDGNAQYAGVGSVQPDCMQSHKHLDAGHGHVVRNRIPFPLYATEHEMVAGGSPARVNGNEGDHDRFDGPTVSIDEGKARISEPVDSSTGAGQPRHGKENRPVNVGVNWLIKYRL